jgi:hypothetical protein
MRTISATETACIFSMTRARMMRELAEALAVLTADRPLVLVLEDLHWSDSSTVEFLAYLAQRREPARRLPLVWPNGRRSSPSSLRCWSSVGVEVKRWVASTRGLCPSSSRAWAGRKGPSPSLPEGEGGQQGSLLGKEEM